MNRSDIGRLVEDERLNAALSWTLVAFVLLVAAGNVANGNLLWAGFAAAVAALALVPPAITRTARAMLPWEVLVLAVLPLLGRTFATLPVAGELSQYLAVAAIALVVAVELHAFTPVEMTDAFAVAFVVVATMAAAGVWAVVRWTLDVTLGTGFLLAPGLPEAVIERRLMFEFVYSTVAGVLAGGLFALYFRRRARPTRRPPEVEG